MDNSDIDVLLAALTRATAEDGFGIGLSLATHGVMVSGQTISPGDWLKLHAEESVARGDAGADFMTELAAGAGGQPMQKTDIEADPRETYGYLHLKDAVVYSGSQSFAVALWRVPLKAVDGWRFGSFTIS